MTRWPTAWFIATRTPAAAIIAVAALAVSALLAPCLAPAATPLQQNNEVMLQRMQQDNGVSAAQAARVREILERSGYAGQGNPAIAVHPMTPQQCRQARSRDPAPPDSAAFEAICGTPNMAPLYDPVGERPEDARACIDQYEFPGLPCEYPVVWVKAREAAELCAAVGKRLCDAHEWEGACDGRLLAPDYRFDLARGVDASTAVNRMRNAHNRALAPDKRWSYGSVYQRGICATGSSKTPGCEGGGWNACGSNTYPAGAFPSCRSPLGVYDLNGNAAEHMSLPLDPSQLASRGSTVLGVTEMKGSWFIFDAYAAHEDWCRWRAPFWHGTRVLDPHSHANYHLGFRCCSTLPPR